jgi:2-dehydropantoate 2-reductase
MEIEVLKSGSFEKVITSHEALTGIGRNMKEIIQVLKAKGSKIGGMTRVFGALPPRTVGLLMSSVMSPNGMSYALIKHNHFKVGYAVREVIADARKYGINAPRLYTVEILITE